MKSLSLQQPHAIIMVGIPGSGKTFFATKFAQTFGAPLIQIEKVAPYATDIDAATTLTRHIIDEFIKTKQTLLIEAGGNSRRERLEFAKFFHEHGYEPLFVWVQTDQETAKSRSYKQKRHDEDSFSAALKRFSPLQNNEKPVVISGKHTYASQAKSVLKRLSEPRAEISSHLTPPIRPNKGRIVVE